MARFECGRYTLEIYPDPSYTIESTDQVVQYDRVHLDESTYHVHSITGIRLYDNGTLKKTAVIGGSGGGTGIHDNSIIVENERVLVCCTDSVFCLSMPDLELLWRTEADPATCFEIFPYQDSYIIHGELQISRLDHDGGIMWQCSGAEIFTSADGDETFSLFDDYILATDWDHRQYKISYDGNFL